MQDTSAVATAYLALGSNLGDRAATMRAAVRALDACPPIRVDFETGVSRLYETSPVGGPSPQPPYLNAAVRIATALSPIELVKTVLSIEEALGRTRRERWGPRAIDIDLLLYDDLILDDANVSVPHPRLHQRRFVLEPLAEIAGGFVHPVLRVSINDLAERLVKADTDETAERVPGPAWLHDRPCGSSHRAGGGAG